MSAKESIPHTPFKEIPYPNPNGKGQGEGQGNGKGEGQGQDARASGAFRQGEGQVGFRRSDGKGKVRIDRKLFFDPLYDPVQIAMLALRLPQISTDANGKTYNNARIMRSYVRRIGEDAFRQLAYQQWRENAVDGEPRSRAATFMAKLWNAWKGGAA